MDGLKKKKPVTYAKFSPNMVKPRDIAGERRRRRSHCYFHHSKTSTLSHKSLTTATHQHYHTSHFHHSHTSTLSHKPLSQQQHYHTTVKSLSPQQHINTITQVTFTTARRQHHPMTSHFHHSNTSTLSHKSLSPQQDINTIPRQVTFTVEKHQHHPTANHFHFSKTPTPSHDKSLSL